MPREMECGDFTQLVRWPSKAVDFFTTVLEGPRTIENLIE